MTLTSPSSLPNSLTITVAETPAPVWLSPLIILLCHSIFNNREPYLEIYWKYIWISNIHSLAHWQKATQLRNLELYPRLCSYGNFQTRQSRQNDPVIPPCDAAAQLHQLPSWGQSCFTCFVFHFTQYPSGAQISLTVGSFHSRARQAPHAVFGHHIPSVSLTLQCFCLIFISTWTFLPQPFTSRKYRRELKVCTVNGARPSPTAVSCHHLLHLFYVTYEFLMNHLKSKLQAPRSLFLIPMIENILLQTAVTSTHARHSVLTSNS